MLITYEDRILGTCVATDSLISGGDVVAHFTGEIISPDDLMSIDPSFHNYPLQISLDTYVMHSSDIAWRVNHSCSPNCWVRVSDPPELVAIRDINPGEQITYDYSLTSTESDGDFAMDCFCGETNCRGVIGGADSMTDEEFESSKKYVPDYVIQSRIL